LFGFACRRDAVEGALMSASYEMHDGVAVVTLDNPPVNGLSFETRRQVAAGIERAEADASVRAIVLTGTGKAFSGGADIKEFGSPKAMSEPILSSLIRQAENCTKPIVAAINGVCMGGGLELALGCHYRVAVAGAKLAMPEVKIGLIPGAGGTLRLPRVLGVETALNLIVKGDPVDSGVLARLPGQKLIDQIVEGDLLAHAIAWAKNAAIEHAQGRPLPRVRDLPLAYPNADAYFQFARNTVKTVARSLPAPLKCVDALEMALKHDFEDGLAREREIFVNLMLTPECRALRHAFFAEREASKVTDVAADTPVRRIDKVAVIGAGTMGGGISMNFLNAGIPVALLEVTQEALDRGVATVRGNYDAQVRKGKLAPEQLDRRLALLKPTMSYDDLKDADLVIEAVFEDLRVKERVFRQLDDVAKPGAILATNTSTLNVDSIASFTRRPQDVLGLHFFSPANVMKLLEVVRGAKTGKDVLATVMQLARKIGKTAVVAGVCDGFIGNRMVEQYLRQAGFLLEEGCTPQQVDRAIENFGFAMGPFRMSDLAGNDVGWAIRKRRYVEKPQLRYSKVADRVCEAGRFGQKTGAGWYDYRAGRRDAIASAAVVEMIEKHRSELGITPRRIGTDEIVQRLVYALVNEGARLLEEGIAQRASDIDIVYLTGYGFPRQRGGPMWYADTVGLFNVAQAMQRFARNPHDDAGFWQPAPLLARLVAESRTFNG
jgi:3-hydroxyacyl-CoA dehydrogenase